MNEIIRIGKGRGERPAAEAVGNKAANLARLAAMGLPVPPAFVLPTSLCRALNAGDAAAEKRLRQGLEQGLAFLEQATGLTLGDRRRPLLASVRSGAAASMPGMMETVLNVGCTHAAVRGLLRARGNPRLAYDCRRRFIEGYADTVLGLPAEPLERELARIMAAENAVFEDELDGAALEGLCCAYERVLSDRNLAVPDDAFDQLLAAARAVFRSWDSERAVSYRRLQGLDHLAGTAVTIQAMVFGNADVDSGAGVAFSRNPSDGDPQPVIDVMFEAQGEDVVSGRRSPMTEAALIRRAPAAATQLREILARAEREFGDVQDMEFTLESGRLFMLQTRSAKRTPRAALRFALDLAADGAISTEEALRRIDALDPAALSLTRFVGEAQAAARGEPAAPGVASGRLVLDSAAAVARAGRGEPVVLARRDTSTADIEGFNAAVGILTAVGGRTAHAALVARQMNKPCVVGCAGLIIDANGREARLGEADLREGDWVSLNGETGEVYIGRREVVQQAPEAELAQVARLRVTLAQTTASGQAVTSAS